MLFDLPDDDTLYAALLARDPGYDGQAYVGVSSTGVFCRLTCPARKPKRENCTFYDSVAACLEAGFRPCKRCHPLDARGDPSATALLAALEARPSHRWSEGDIIAMGYDPSTVRRTFKRQFGMTFLDMARLTRLREGFEALSTGAPVIDAQLSAGFDSASGFRAAFAKLMGTAPGNLTGKELLKADWLQTPLGPMITVSDARHLHLLEFFDRRALPTELKRLAKSAGGSIGIGRFDPTEQIEAELTRFFAGQSAEFTVPLAYHGSSFARAVWEQLRQIPPGTTRSYGDLARDIGQPSATRAVARANGANQLAIIVPCHRVIGADGTLTGYGGGLWRKRALLDLERQLRDAEPKAS